MKTLNYDGYPMFDDVLKGTIDRYVIHGIKPGSFMTAVIENDLMSAFMRADSYNRTILYDICHFLYNRVPFEAWGSPEKVVRWLEQFHKN